jgi:pimeloyl-ACP methyl ester carboxylesterase
MAKVAVGEENGTPVELYFEDHGTGDPVVLIHCWPLSSRVWEAQVPALVDAGHRVIAYDRRGFGRSSQPWAGYDYDTLAADLNALLEHLDLRDATLVGYSMGGGEVVRYIATYGTDRVARSVLAATALPYRYKADDNPEGDADDALVAQFQDVVKRDRLALSPSGGRIADTVGDVEFQRRQKPVGHLAHLVVVESPNSPENGVLGDRRDVDEVDVGLLAPGAALLAVAESNCGRVPAGDKPAVEAALCAHGVLHGCDPRDHHFL